MRHSRKVNRMALFGFLPPHAADPRVKELADFIDEQAAFLMQKGICDYSRARAGPHAKVMLSEPEIREIVRGIALARLSARARRWWAKWSRACCVRMPAPTNVPCSTNLPISCSLCSTAIRCREPIGKDAWLDARSELALRLDQISLHPPKRVIDIPEQYVQALFRDDADSREACERATSAPRSAYLKLNACEYA